MVYRLGFICSSKMRPVGDCQSGRGIGHVELIGQVDPGVPVEVLDVVTKTFLTTRQRTIIPAKVHFNDNC